MGISLCLEAAENILCVKDLFIFAVTTNEDTRYVYSISLLL